MVTSGGRAEHLRWPVVMEHLRSPSKRKNEFGDIQRLQDASATIKRPRTVPFSDIAARPRVLVKMILADNDSQRSKAVQKKEHEGKMVDTEKVDPEEKKEEVKEAEVAVKDEEIEVKEAEVEVKDEEIDMKEAEVEVKDEEIDMKEAEVEVKDEEIDMVEAEVEVEDEEVEVKDEEVEVKDEEMEVMNELMIPDLEMTEGLFKLEDLEEVVSEELISFTDTITGGRWESLPMKTREKGFEASPSTSKGMHQAAVQHTHHTSAPHKHISDHNYYTHVKHISRGAETFAVLCGGQDSLTESTDYLKPTTYRPSICFQGTSSVVITKPHDSKSAEPKHMKLAHHQEAYDKNRYCAANNKSKIEGTNQNLDINYDPLSVGPEDSRDTDGCNQSSHEISDLEFCERMELEAGTGSKRMVKLQGKQLSEVNKISNLQGMMFIESNCVGKQATKVTGQHQDCDQIFSPLMVVKEPAQNEPVCMEPMQREEKPYKCPYCGVRFMEGDNMNIHRLMHEQLIPESSTDGESSKQKVSIEDITPVTANPCQSPDCGEICVTKNSVEVHTVLHSREEVHEFPEHRELDTYKCSIDFHRFFHTGTCSFKSQDCEEVFPSRDLREFEENTFFCPNCGQRFKLESDVQEHKENCITNKLFECSDCGNLFNHIYKLVNHSVIHVGRKAWNCPICGCTFESMEILQKHKQIHFKEKCPDCGMKFTLETDVEEHKQIHVHEKPFECPVCGKIFRRMWCLEEHLLQQMYLVSAKEQPVTYSVYGKECVDNKSLKSHSCINTGERHQCPYMYCEERFTQDSEMQKHTQEVHLGKPFAIKLETHVEGDTQIHNINLKPFECLDCGERFKNKNDLKEHTKIHTSNKLYECTICGNKFTHRYYLLSHRVIHAGTKAWHCQICGGTFEKMEYLEKHVLIHYKKKCPDCRMKFILKTEMEEHRKTHIHERPFECPICGQRFSKIWYREEHIQQNHMMSDRQNKMSHTRTTSTCLVCGKAFESKNSLKEHSYIHMRETHECPHCGRTFANNFSMQKHEREAHFMDFVCKYCPTRFNSTTALQEHTKIHMELKPFKCLDCGQRFKLKNDLKEHTEIHMSNKLLECADCGNKFTHRYYLLSHRVIHAGEKAWHCQICGGTFEKMEHLDKHVLIHYKKKCPDCGKKFTRKTDVEKHRKTHVHKKPYACPICEKRFSRIWCWEDHIQQNYLMSAKQQLRMFASTENITADTKVFCTCTDAQLCMCFLCGKALKHKIFLKEHMYIHGGEKHYECLDCGKIFNLRNMVWKHIKLIHVGEKPFVCTYCGERFALKTNLQQHTENHFCESFNIHKGEDRQECPDCGKILTSNYNVLISEWPFKCSKCGLRFKLEHDMEEHKKLHVSEKIFEYPDCGQSFKLKTDLKEHIEIHIKEKTYECSKCGLKFKLKRDMEEHKKLHVSEKIFECPDCGQSFKLKTDLKEHTQMHMKEKPFKCSDCGQRFKLETDLEEHTEIHIKEKPFECCVCGQRFKLETNLEEHTQIHKKEKPFACPDCGMRFKREGMLKKHGKTHMSDEPFVCGICGKRYKYKHNLINHSVSHVGEKTWRCPICGKIFKTMNLLKYHRQTHMKKKCPDCNKAFTSDIALEEHRQIHVRGKPFQCSDCGKRFKRKKYLEKHTCVQQLQDHVESSHKPFKCSVCEKKFALERDMEEHNKIHTSEKNFECPNCGQRFTLQAEMEEHDTTVHASEKPFKCQLCGKRFMDQWSLKGHKQQYLLEPPKQKCPICGKQFKSMTSLKKHSFVHVERQHKCSHCGKSCRNRCKLLGLKQLNPKPFTCAVCGKAFASRVSLRNHGYLHTGEKPYECPVCGKKFTIKDNVLKHVKQVHKPSKCSICGNGFILERDMEEHRQAHIREQPFECPDCEQRFNQEADMEEHRKMHIKHFKCAVCGKIFEYKNDIVNHSRRNHPGEKVFQCPICEKRLKAISFLDAHKKRFHAEAPWEKSCKYSVSGKSFQIMAYLRKHKLIHTENPHECADCGKKCSDSDSLRTHKQVFHNPLKCYLCGNVFTQEKDLEEHKNIYTREKTVKCPDCGVGFSLECNMEEHRRVHMPETVVSERLLECTDCQHRFYTTKNLAKHRQLYHKLFRCSVCGKGYDNKPQLETHMREIHGEEPYKCSLCGKTFGMNCYLLRHKRVMHSEEKLV